MSLRRRLTSSFRARMLWGMLLLNLVALSVLVIAGYTTQNQRLQLEKLRTQEYVLSQLTQLFASGLERDEVTVRSLIEFPGWRYVLRDALVMDRSQSEENDSERIAINPLGAFRRNPDQVDIVAVTAGIRRAMANEQPVEASGGLCLPLHGRDGRVIGGGWFLLWNPIPAAPVPVVPVITALLLSSLVFAVLAYQGFQRRLLQPIERLSSAAEAISQGDYAVRVAPGGGAEVAGLIEVFNGMVAKVEGYQRELRRVVAQAMAEARQSERALIRSSRLASMGTLAAGIAHEINNPIGGMLNAVRKLRAETSDERAQRYLDLVLSGLDRMHRTVRRVLDFSPRAATAATFSLVDEIGRARALVEHQLQQDGVQLTLDLVDWSEDDPPRVVGDGHEIQQVFLNLFLNSLDAIQERERKPGAPTLPPGRIAVRLRRVEGEGGKPFVLVEVRDNGCGLAEDKLEQVFDPFFSSKRSPTATGLGLAISHAILRNHQGSIEVESRRGEGFKAVIRLPVA